MFSRHECLINRGGNVVQWSDGKFHLYAAEIAEHCGMAAWHTNSFITHAISDTVNGTYTKSNVAVKSWAHNPQTIAFGDELFIFHIGPGDGTAVQVNCRNSTSASDTSGTVAPENEQLTQVHVASGPNGPWTVVPGGGVLCDNPSPLVLRNGTALLMCSRSAGSPPRPDHPHARLYSAPSLRGPWKHVSEVYTESDWSKPSPEDPFLWEDARGNLHTLWHTGPLNRTNKPRWVPGKETYPDPYDY
jgi:hypothetical protein